MINRNLYFKGRPEWTIYLLNGIKELFEQNECMHIYNHSLQVVNNAVELANRFHVRKEIKMFLSIENWSICVIEI